MTKPASHTLDENTRRYYLEVMGVQCWQSLEGQQSRPVQQPESQTIQLPETEVRPADVPADMTQLSAAIEQCDSCGLRLSRKRSLAGCGNPQARLMFLFLSPLAEGEGSQAVTGSAEADALFGKMLSAINISKDDVYMSTLLKCDVPQNHTISPAEISRCKPYLERQVQLLRPELLVVLGETAARCLLQKNLSIDELRSANTGDRPVVEGAPLLVSYSPLELLLQPENKRKAWADLQQIQHMLAAE